MAATGCPPELEGPPFLEVSGRDRVAQGAFLEIPGSPKWTQNRPKMDHSALWRVQFSSPNSSRKQTSAKGRNFSIFRGSEIWSEIWSIFEGHLDRKKIACWEPWAGKWVPKGPRPAFSGSAVGGDLRNWTLGCALLLNL